ncbi:MAG TPA: Omp28-related outer membrane protein, partial [Candidatus Cloacimonadota bacterium]|nr:Omp28-related outer membrane protein [Candidatus Cloacimonadota bacterium]
MKNSALILLLLAVFTMLSAVPRELVVVEIATGTWCGYCPGAAMGAHDLLDNGHAVAIVKNHNGDPYANTYSNARNNYYGVSGFPTAYFDGLNPSVGGSATQSMYSNYLPKVNARLGVPAKYTISANGSMNGNDITVMVTVAKPEADTNTNVVLHSSVTQSHIPANWGNQTTVENVNRVMSPNQNGTPINLGTGESTTVNLSFTLDSSWNFNLTDLELVLWLQNVSTKETL